MKYCKEISEITVETSSVKGGTLLKIIDKFDLMFAFLESFPHKIFLDTVKRVEITRIKDSIADLSPSKIQETPSIFDSWDSVNYLILLVSFELLWEIFEESS